MGSQESGVRGQESVRRSQESGVGEWKGVFSHKEQEKQEVSGVGVGEWSCRAKLAAERKSERMDTAYSPRLHEEELSATANAQKQTPPAKKASGVLQSCLAYFT